MLFLNSGASSVDLFFLAHFTFSGCVYHFGSWEGFAFHCKQYQF